MKAARVPRPRLGFNWVAAISNFGYGSADLAVFEQSREVIAYVRMDDSHVRVHMARPVPRFAEFIGQRRLVRYVQRLVMGFRQTCKPLPPLLLLGPSGHGKTAFAEALAVELDTKMHAVTALDNLRPQELYAQLRETDFGDVLFVDESHLLGRDAQHALYAAIDRHMIPALAENRPSSLVLESIADFHLILATNTPGMIRKALRSRTVELPFESYSVRELTAIAQRAAVNSNIRLSPQAARLIAATAQGSPRRVHQRVQILPIYSPNVAAYSVVLVRELLKSEGIDAHGLTLLHRNYLRTLAKMPKQRCTLDHLAFHIGLDCRFVREELEYYLVEQDYVEALSSGARRLTPRGSELISKLEAN